MSPPHDDSKSSTSQRQSTAHAADWNEHEHVSEQVQREAQKLVDQAGSAGIAKMAIEVLENQQSKSQSKGIDPSTPSND